MFVLGIIKEIALDIFIGKNVLNNKDLSNSVIATYIALRSIYNQKKDCYYINPSMLCFELFGNSSYTRYTKESITEGLVALELLGLIKTVEDISKTETIYDLSALFIDEEEYYVILRSDEIHSICNLDERVDKFGVLRYFACMIGTIDYNSHIYIGSGSGCESVNNFVGYMTQDYLASLCGIPTTTIINYNRILEENELIYIYRHNSYRTEEGSIKSICNHYGRYENAEYIIQFAEQYEDVTGGDNIIRAKKDANYRRSMTQKYHALCNGKEYSETEVKEIKEHVLKNNEKYENMMLLTTDDTTIKEYSNKILDTSVFDRKVG